MAIINQQSDKNTNQGISRHCDLFGDAIKFSY